MKNFLFVLLAAIIAAGCTKAEEDSLTVVEKQKEELLAELKQVNKEFLSIVAEGDTRGRWNWKKILGVALADWGGAKMGAEIGGAVGALGGPAGATAGALIGGTALGAAASYAVLDEASTGSGSFNPMPYISHVQIVNNPWLFHGSAWLAPSHVRQNVISSANVQVTFPAAHAELMEVGITHNTSLKYLGTAITDPDIFLVDDETNSILGSILFQIHYRNIVNNIRNYYDPATGDFDYLGFKTLYYDPDYQLYDEILELFAEAYLQANPIGTSPTSANSIDGLINSYIEVIERPAYARIVDHRKNVLYAAFSVAAYSPRLWNELLADE